jgi:hypothetical protein
LRQRVAGNTRFRQGIIVVVDIDVMWQGGSVEIYLIDVFCKPLFAFF